MTDWRKYNGAIIPITPPHIEVNTGGIEEKIKSNNAFFARWTSDFDNKEKSEFWYVICDKFIPLEELSRNTRNNIRRGLKRCEVRKVTHQFIMENAYPIYRHAFDNYKGHLTPLNEFDFLKEYSIYNDENIWDFWAVFENETSEMIAFARNKIEFNQCELCSAKFHPNYLRKFYPSEALFYTLNHYYLNERNLRYINDGARSISHETNIQSFLIQKFKFRKAYCKLNIVYSPKIKLIVSIIFPFKSIISLLKFGFFIRINILINQEIIRRSYEKGK